jgi:hypothetical protein
VSAAGAAEGFGLGSLAATYDLSGAVQVFARADNITDETYEQPLAFAGRPRSVVVGLRARR